MELQTWHKRDRAEKRYASKVQSLDGQGKSLLQSLVQVSFEMCDLTISTVCFVTDLTSLQCKIGFWIARCSMFVLRQLEVNAFYLLMGIGAPG